MKLKNNNLQIKFLVVAVVALGAVYWWFGKSHNMPQMHAGGAVEVEAQTLISKPIQKSLSLPGRVNAYKQAVIRPQVSGIITERLFKQGDLVEKGQQLYQIDPTAYQSVYNSAMADLKKAQAQSERFKELVKINAVSKQAYDDAVASLAQAQASVDVAKVNLDYTKVYAPISGYIGRSYITEGELVSAGQAKELAEITQVSPVYVDVTMPAANFAKVKSELETAKELAMKVLVDGKEISETAKVSFTEFTVSASTGTVTLRGMLENNNLEVLPGMFVRGELQLLPQNLVTVSHAHAVRTPQGGLVVWVVGKDNTVNPQPIEAYESYGNSWIVESGVNDGDVIVTKGFQKIGPGATVTPVLAQTSNSATQTSANDGAQK